MTNTQLSHAVFAAIMLASASAASAQSSPQTTNFNVTATVAANCTVTATPVIFGPYDPVTANASAALTNGAGTVAVTCTQGSLPIISLNDGTNGPQASASRSMSGTGTGADFLGYELFLPPSVVANTACVFPATNVWNATTGTLATTAAPSNAARTYYICGSVPGGQDVAVDSYTDTVMASITF